MAVQYLDYKPRISRSKMVERIESSNDTCGVNVGHE